MLSRRAMMRAGDDAPADNDAGDQVGGQ